MAGQMVCFDTQYAMLLRGRYLSQAIWRIINYQNDHYRAVSREHMAEDILTDIETLMIIVKDISK